MRIKRLEVQGFKSFKDKTVIHFDHSITGIVGPNGCGKSNIVDAFFWVMGEQSYKHMRGSGSEDLIFNGSIKYTPLGLAEATLIMETDAPEEKGEMPAGATTHLLPLHLRCKEISVTRRVYRSGEGEYFINGVPARLKDIQELFMDTGVGSKGYSIVEQGQIGKIVNAKPEDRRLLIEEAAGIAKYKARKKESIRKMEATEANLSRLTDVLQEIERNLRSLERQAQKARLFKKYKDELLDKEMTWGRRRSKLLKGKLESLKKSRESLEHEVLGFKTELQIAENGIESDRALQLTDSKSADDLQTKVQNLSSSLTREQSSLELSVRRQGDLSSQLASLSIEREALQKAILGEHGSLQLLEREFCEVDRSLKSVEEKALAMDSQVRSVRDEVGTDHSKLDLSKKEWANLLNESSQLMAQVATFSSRIESARALLDKYKEEVRESHSKVDIAKGEAEHAKDAFGALQENKKTLKSEIEKLGFDLATQASKERQSEADLNEARKQFALLNSRLQSLEELDAAHEGFTDAPKAVLDWVRNLGKENQIQALADGLEVQAGFEVAVQGWLGARIESLIALDPALAMEALEIIRSQKQGRASLIVARGVHFASQNVRPYSEIQNFLSETGFEVIGELSSFVKVSGKFSEVSGNWVAPLFSNICLVKNFESFPGFMAARGAEQLSGWSLLSLQGEVFNFDGTLQGGTPSGIEQTSVLGRKRAISDLKLESDQHSKRLSELENSFQEVKTSVEGLRSQERVLLAKKQTLDIEEARLIRDLEGAARNLNEAEKLAGLKQEELKQTEQSLEQDQIKFRETESETSQLKARREELEKQITEWELEISNRQSGLREQERVLQDLRVDEASLRERVSSLRRVIDSARMQVGDKEQRLLDLGKNFERISQDHSKQCEGDGGIRFQIEEITRNLGRAQEELSLVKDRIEQSMTRVNQGLERIKELHQIGEQKTAQSTEFALEIEKVSGEHSFLVQNLEEKYGPGCLERPVPHAIQEEMSEPVITTEMTAEEEQALFESVEKLRERIRRLGEVNIMAIDEYDELKKRFDHLAREKADLEQSITNLKEAIEYINKTSEDRFQKAFNSIAERFEKLFPIIFGAGAQAELALVYPEGSSDILEAGVDILAQPPGKKISNITLLSGGEKALTAVALIFAIFMVKPSPFCVLDEVDAPLDDANIGKFNALLREMSAKSQFILITHNKKTMELNDTLYGVTMEEPGVSKMVSIEMR